jgi:hypothetical protein
VIDPARRAQLNAAKLAALVREHNGERLTADQFAGGAACVADGGHGWVLVDDVRYQLGAALAWALRRRASRLSVVSADTSGAIARRAAGFAMPIEVWAAEGGHLRRAVADPLPSVPPAPAAVLELVDVIVRAGADPVVEHGVLTGEVRGLEVCRATVDEATGVARLEVGIGAHDREAFALLHGDRPTVDALADVVRTIADTRREGAPPHPLNRLAAARAVRAELLDHPARVGAAWCRAADSPVPRSNLKDPTPCIAEAEINGQLRAVVCVAGVDLEVLPFAVDVQRSTGHDVVVAARANDITAIHREMSAMMRRPAQFCPV